MLWKRNLMAALWSKARNTRRRLTQEQVGWPQNKGGMKTTQGPSIARPWRSGDPKPSTPHIDAFRSSYGRAWRIAFEPAKARTVGRLIIRRRARNEPYAPQVRLSGKWPY